MVRFFYFDGKNGTQLIQYMFFRWHAHWPDWGDGFDSHRAYVLWKFIKWPPRDNVKNWLDGRYKDWQRDPPLWFSDSYMSIFPIDYLPAAHIEHLRKKWDCFEKDPPSWFSLEWKRWFGGRPDKFGRNAKSRPEDAPKRPESDGDAYATNSTGNHISEHTSSSASSWGSFGSWTGVFGTRISGGWLEAKHTSGAPRPPIIEFSHQRSVLHWI